MQTKKREQAFVCGNADLLDGPGYQPMKNDIGGEATPRRHRAPGADRLEHRAEKTEASPSGSSAPVALGDLTPDELLEAASWFVSEYVRLTKTDLVKTLGELAKVGLIVPYRDVETTRYRLSKPALLIPRDGPPTRMADEDSPAEGMADF